jgi:MFS family permease
MAVDIIASKKEDNETVRYLSPVQHLALFCVCQTLVYYDRGVLAGMLKYIEVELGNLSGIQSGLLPSMFMVGFMIASPLFVRLSQISRDWQVYTIIIGLSVLVVSSVVTYFVATSYAGLLVARLISGVGEAAFCALAPPIIDTAAPVGRKSLYVGIYFTFLYVGYGLGSGICVIFDSWQSGRVLYLAGAGLIACCIAVFALLRKRFLIPEGAVSSVTGSLLHQLKVVFTQSVFVLLCVGYGFFFFTFGAFAFWIPTYLARVYKDQKNLADIGFGAVTCLTGIIGTVVGGALMELISARLAKKDKFKNLSHDYIMVISGCIICCVLVFSGMLITIPAVFTSSIYIFFIFFAFGTLLLFSTTAPVNIAIMYSVPTSLKAQSMAVSVGVAHLIGDFPSPSITGVLIDYADFDTAILAVSGILVIPTALWAFSGYLSKKQGDVATASVDSKPTQNPEASTIMQ